MNHQGAYKKIGGRVLGGGAIKKDVGKREKTNTKSL